MPKKEIMKKLEGCTFEELDSIRSAITDMIDKNFDKYMEASRKKYEMNHQTRLRAKKKFEAQIPKITAWLESNLKTGDIVKCKGYTGYKKAIEIKDGQLFAFCGRLRKGEFENSGYGSQSAIYNITHIFKNHKFETVKELMQKTPKICSECGGSGDVRTSSRGLLGYDPCSRCNGTGTE
jgi:DnaJ-class molecular chaperone